MIVYFADRAMNILGLATTKLGAAFRLYDDVKTENLEDGTSTFEFTVPFDDASELALQDYTEAGNFLLRADDNDMGTYSAEDADAYTIIETEIDAKDRTISVYCEDAGMDLINEVFGDYAPGSQTVEAYVNYFASDSGFKIGINELGGVKKSIVFEGENTGLARLAEVASNFGCNLSYSFGIRGLTIVSKKINIWVKRGRDSGVQLQLGKEIDDIRTTKTVANVATRLIAYGATPDGKNDPINLKTYARTDGDYYTPAGDVCLYSKSAQEKWKRRWITGQVSGGEITQTYTNEGCKTQAELFTAAEKKLAELKDTQISYEVSISNYDDLKIGDYVYVVDDKGELYLKARVQVLETSVCNNTVKATLGEFAKKTSGISDYFERIAKEWAIAHIYSITIESASGIMFKNSSINTVLTAHVFKNNEELDSTDVADLGAVLKWYKDETLLGTGRTYQCQSSQTSEIITCRLELTE